MNQLFELNDPDSRTRSGALDVVHARAVSVSKLDADLFAGFASMRALTYTSSIPMICRLLSDHDYADFECVFGHGGIVSRSASDIMAFQNVVDEKLHKGFVGVSSGGLSEKRRRIIYDRAAKGVARFYVVKDAIAHAKIYLLERGDLKRVVVGSANLSETAFSGRQAETLVVFDNDETAWKHYSAQYDAVRDIAVSPLHLRPQPVRVEDMSIAETPIFKEAESKPDGVTLYVPAENDEEVEYSAPTVISRVEVIKPARQKALADIRPDRNGRVDFTENVVRQIVRIATSRQEDEGPKTYLSYDGERFTFSDGEMPLAANESDVRGDVSAWLEFFGNYQNGFVGDVPRLQRDYFTFMCWFYFSPLMCDVRNNMIRRGQFSFDQPMFAVVYGQSNCGKSSLIETLMRSMFSRQHLVDTRSFTAGNLRGLQEAYRRFPVVFDDVTRDRFSRHAPEVIKDESIRVQEYPCFALSMNAEARNFPPEIVKRCLMIYTRTSLPGDDPAARRTLQRSVADIRDRLTTALYREFLRRSLEELKSISDYSDLDVLWLSSSTLCRIFEENLPGGVRIPAWCAPMTLDEYQGRAFERPRLVLENLLHPDKSTRERRPEAGSWTISGNLIVVASDPMSLNRTKADIPDWILDDTASVSGQIALNRGLVEDFLGRSVRMPRRLWPPWG